MIIELTKELFEEKISSLEKEFSFKGDRPALLKFEAEWCGPCKQLAPVVEKLSEEYDKIDFYKIDVDKEQELAGAFGIQSVPSLLFIPVSGDPQMAIGAIPKESFKKAFKDIFGIE